MSPYSTPPDLVPSPNVPGSPHAAVRGKKRGKVRQQKYSLYLFMIYKKMEIGIIINTFFSEE